ncbi:MAG: zf-HC2 domain-containing protein [SAR202 cluster bacterium]|nr:zf-HC2 domain-containing protein [SAR202 cluster bacterium]
MPHKHYQKLIEQAMDGRLEPADRIALETHLAFCDDCRAFAPLTGQERAGLAAWYRAPAA